MCTLTHAHSVLKRFLFSRGTGGRKEEDKNNREAEDGDNGTRTFLVRRCSCDSNKTPFPLSLFLFLFLSCSLPPSLLAFAN